MHQMLFGLLSKKNLFKHDESTMCKSLFADGCFLEALMEWVPLTHYQTMPHFDKQNIAVENIVRKGEIACDKQFLLFLQCFLPYTTLIFHFKCTLKCRLQFVSIWTSLKFFRLVMG